MLRDEPWQLARTALGLFALLPSAAGQMEAPATPSELRFVENIGQWEHPARFVATSGPTRILASERSFEVVRRSADAAPSRQRFVFEGARDVLPQGGGGGLHLARGGRSANRPRAVRASCQGSSRSIDGDSGERVPRGLGRTARGGGDEDASRSGELPGTHAYFLGQEPERWRSGVRAFAAVAYPELYPGVELRLRAAGGHLEYDLFLAPGADVSLVLVSCPDVRGLRLDGEGGLVLESDEGPLRQTPPVTWCVLPDGERLPLECSFELRGPRSFGFRLGEHDRELAVVIDPGLEWATFLGGGSAEVPAGLVTRADGSVVQFGLTQSGDFPLTVPSIGATGGGDVYVSIFDPTGSTLLHSLVLGGSERTA